MSRVRSTLTAREKDPVTLEVAKIAATVWTGNPAWTAAQVVDAAVILVRRVAQVLTSP